MKQEHRQGPPRGSSKKVALPRFQAEHWPRWLEIVQDHEAWKASFEEWRDEAEARAERLNQAGLEIVWIDLEPESFATWCRSRGYANDAESRNRFAAERVGNIPAPVRPNST